jgi:hypothetical protein
MNELLPKDTKLCTHGHASRRKCDVCDYEDVCSDMAELTDQVIKLRDEREELRRDVARWVNAHRVAMVERDLFKGQAEINAQTVIRQASEIHRLERNRREIFIGEQS